MVYSRPLETDGLANKANSLTVNLKHLVFCICILSASSVWNEHTGIQTHTHTVLLGEIKIMLLSTSLPSWLSLGPWFLEWNDCADRDSIVLLKF